MAVPPKSPCLESTFNMRSRLSIGLVLLAQCLGGSSLGMAQEGKIAIPRKQTAPPGPPLAPEAALAKMSVPEGFRVELVAAEPDLLNPVAMAFDERGRIWVTESFEYPRHEPGPGRDRIKILEDTNGDGRIDSVKIFADGLNIPSGIAVGHGGVWVANAPDILFLQDTDGDDKADKTEVVVTGFGRFDTHELPNSLTWGPDGCLYGLNGVFNPCRVESDGKVYEFTCAMFRIDPTTRKFDLFCEGTSNPWGITFDPEGQAFISACVIDHLWHLTETGYYHRQGGPYPPHTWKIESIVEHKHQMAAYCGITYFDSDAYPPAFRDQLIMGNIHGNCLNVDRLERNGSTYKGFGEADFLSGNDVWFMPVVQKVGPDGCLYVLDWYDRYHCYQDASADPEGVDRGHGRLYRVVHEATGRPEPVVLAGLSPAALVEHLKHANVAVRETAQRLLAEQHCQGVVSALEAIVLDDQAQHKARMHALWSLIGGKAVSAEFAADLLQCKDDSIRAWGVRTVGDLWPMHQALSQQCAALAADASPDVQLQVAIAAGKLEHIDRMKTWVDVLCNCGEDPLIPHIVWQNLNPLLPAKSDALLAMVEQVDLEQAPGLAAMLSHVAEKLQD
jgi:putative membrane-bound dehydrogenase-like protein